MNALTSSGIALNPAGWKQAPYIEQWLGVWAMREAEFMGLAEVVRGLNLSVHMNSGAPEAARDDAQSRAPVLQDAVALISISGRMQKMESSLALSTSTVEVRRQIRAAAANPDIGSIVLLIDSPGGTVAGTKDLADDVAAAAARKPIVAYLEDMAASAAYWVASQCTEIRANATALVGSIGTYGVVYDMSAKAAIEGVKVHVVRAGAFKGAGVGGTEVTPEQLAEFQREIDALNEYFVDGVAAGRKLDKARVQALADGRVWIGQEAISAGLIDGVSTIDEAVARATDSVTTVGVDRLGRIDPDAVAANAAGTQSAYQTISAHVTRARTTGLRP